MSVDLLAVLAGRREDDAPRPDPDDVVTTMRCPCGDVVALLARSGGESWLWRASYRHTPRGAADIVLDAVLEDFEALARVAEDRPDLEDEALSDELAVLVALTRAHDGDSLAALLPPLRIPARLRRVTGLAGTLAELDAGRDGLAPSRPAHTEAGCRTCRRVLYLGDVLREVEPAAAPPVEVIVRESPRGGARGVGYVWPESARAGRVVMYRALSDVLVSD